MRFDGIMRRTYLDLKITSNICENILWSLKSEFCLLFLSNLTSCPCTTVHAPVDPMEENQLNHCVQRRPEIWYSLIKSFYYLKVDVTWLLRMREDRAIGMKIWNYTFVSLWCATFSQNHSSTYCVRLTRQTTGTKHFIFAVGSGSRLNWTAIWFHNC